MMRDTDQLREGIVAVSRRVVFRAQHQRYPIRAKNPDLVVTSDRDADAAEVRRYQHPSKQVARGRTLPGLFEDLQAVGAPK